LQFAYEKFKSIVTHIATSTIPCKRTAFVGTVVFIMNFNIDLRLKNESGVYIIKNNIDNRKYIGSTNNFFTRYSDHKGELSRKTHINKFLQNFVDKYGINSLSFNLLCLCKIEYLRYNEKILIDQIKPEFNLKVLVVPDLILYDMEKQKMNVNNLVDEIINENKIIPLFEDDFKLTFELTSPIPDYIPTQEDFYLPF
jgi:predicted GIY-YIG superfamily endonuclease